MDRSSVKGHAARVPATLTANVRDFGGSKREPGTNCKLKSLRASFHSICIPIIQLTREEAIGAARFLASVFGAAHATNGQERPKKMANDPEQNRSKKLDVPSWLWTSVVELVAKHESAYLEHCRQYALKGAQSR